MLVRAQIEAAQDCQCLARPLLGGFGGRSDLKIVSMLIFQIRHIKNQVYHTFISDPLGSIINTDSRQMKKTIQVLLIPLCVLLWGCQTRYVDILNLSIVKELLIVNETMDSRGIATYPNEPYTGTLTGTITRSAPSGEGQELEDYLFNLALEWGRPVEHLEVTLYRVKPRSQTFTFHLFEKRKEESAISPIIKFRINPKLIQDTHLSISSLELKKTISLEELIKKSKPKELTPEEAHKLSL